MTNKHFRLSNVDTAEVIKVIKIESVVGEGTTEDPIRLITEYFALSGERLARTEPGSNVEKIHLWKESEDK